MWDLNQLIRKMYFQQIVTNTKWRSASRIERECRRRLRASIFRNSDVCSITIYNIIVYTLNVKCTIPSTINFKSQMFPMPLTISKLLFCNQPYLFSATPFSYRHRHWWDRFIWDVLYRYWQWEILWSSCHANNAFIECREGAQSLRQDSSLGFGTTDEI